jgi:hypothetical protein
MEYILRNAVLALLEYPNATLLEIMKLLVDPVFRRKVLYHVKDPVIRDFFINEYEKYDPKFRTEAIAPIQNKVGQFLSSSTIRNIMGQEKSTIDIRTIMDTGKILLVDLSVGKIGEDNAALLGSMIITKIQLAAMGRADQPEEERKDFYLYVDEFQNFATESFAVILSEARKYHLNLIITHQYIAQMPEVVASAVFGNVGTIVAFRVGAGDASALAREFEPVFDANDLVNLDNYYVYLKMAIDARTATPFSAITLPPFSGKNGNRDQAVQQSIARYSANRDEVEKLINDRNEANTGKIGTLVEVDGEFQYQETIKPYEPMNPLPKNTEVDGVEVWKIRDQEGKPFYVAGEDYDAYMESKGKPSDRPGAPAPKPKAEDGGVGDANIINEPVVTEAIAQAVTPASPSVPTPESAAKPVPQPPKPEESTNIVRHKKEGENNFPFSTKLPEQPAASPDARPAPQQPQQRDDNEKGERAGQRDQRTNRQPSQISTRPTNTAIQTKPVVNDQLTVADKTTALPVMKTEAPVPAIVRPPAPQPDVPTAVAERFNDLSDTEDDSGSIIPLQEL